MNLQTSPANNSRILGIKNAKFSGYCFYMSTNIEGYFQICISVPLIYIAPYEISFMINRVGAYIN